MLPFDENAKFKCQACYCCFVRKDDIRKHRKSALHKQNQKLYDEQQAQEKEAMKALDQAKRQEEAYAF